MFFQIKQIKLYSFQKVMKKENPNKILTSKFLEHLLIIFSFNETLRSLNNLRWGNGHYILPPPSLTALEYSDIHCLYCMLFHDVFNDISG